MNALDRVINYFSPVRGMVRARARNATRIYEGASTGRRGASWRSTSSGANSELQAAIRPLRDRSRDLARNNPHATRILDIVTAYAVGTGLIPVSSTGADKIDRKVTELWNEWNKNADVTGRLTFDGIQVLAVRSMVESGEVVVRFIDTPMTDKTCIPFKVQLLEADFIDHYRDGIDQTTPDAPGVKNSRIGVGLGDYDQFLGLWLWPYHPGENTTVQSVALTSEFIKKENLAHMFKVLRPGQLRGVPWFAPILTTARDMADLLDAVNVKVRVEACFAGFIINDENTQPLLDEDTSIGSIDPTNRDATVTTLEPGMLKELRTGQDIKFAAPTTTSQIEPILLFNLQAMAAGAGLTYDLLTGDLRQASYTSLRAGKIDFWKLIGQLQKITVIPMLCQPTWDYFIKTAILAGRLPQRRGGYPCEWVVPAKDMIDPKKDFDSLKNAVRSGAITPQQFIASFGGNWRDNIEAFKAFFAMAHDAEVTLDIDVAAVDQHGRQPPKGATDAGTEAAITAGDDAEAAAADRESDREDA